MVQVRCHTLAFAILYWLKTNIAFVGQPVFQSFATNVVVLEEKMVNEGLRRFFLVNGKRIRQLQQRFACLKKATFRLLFFCWFGEKNENFVFGCFLLHKENKMRKFQTTFASCKKATKQITILNPFFTKRTTYSNIVSFLHEKHESGEMHESGNDFATLGSQQAAKHFHLDSLFFPAIFVLEKEKFTL